MAVLMEQCLIEASAVDADSNGDMVGFAAVHHGLDPVFPADVAGVDADFGRAPLRRRNGQAIVKVDVGHQGQRRRRGNLPKARGRLHVRHGQAGNLAPGGCQSADLGEGALHVGGLRIEHGLNGYRRAAAHRDAAYLDLSRHIKHLSISKCL